MYNLTISSRASRVDSSDVVVLVRMADMVFAAKTTATHDEIRELANDLGLQHYRNLYTKGLNVTAMTDDVLSLDELTVLIVMMTADRRIRAQYVARERAAA